MDLSPGYREFAPPRALRGVVDCLWTRVSGASREVRIVPDGCTDLVWRQGEGTVVAGPDTGPKLVTVAEGDLLVGMRLLPGAGGAVLEAPVDAVRDLRVPAAELGREFDLHGGLEPLEVLRRFAAVAAERRTDPVVAQAVHQVARQGVGPAARELGISERQLRRRFHSAAGYGPKTLSRILRFRRFVRSVERGGGDLARLAAEAGYADQAHLTRETRRLAGLPPTAFVRHWATPPAG